jgi:predicted GIY-YIG superfamily endonuclease
MVYIYVLELEGKKFYVGKTTNPKMRIVNHFESYGSSWTRKYKPIKNLLAFKKSVFYL